MPCKCRKCERVCDCGEIWCEDCIVVMGEDDVIDEEYEDENQVIGG